MTKTNWKLTKKILQDTLLKPSIHSKKGLLLEPYEFGGVIKFENNNCRIIEGEQVCDKSYSHHSIEKGNDSHVSTPNGKVNFHTHPLHCYISGKVIWGWPSGEDMAQCIRFGKMGNLYHIIFCLEGTYVVTVNKKLLTLNSRDIDKIETIFKLTHQYRTYEDCYSEFKNFIQGCGLKPAGKNTMELWLYFASHFMIRHCIFYTDPINSLPPTTKAFKILFFKNNSIQYNLNPATAYSKLKSVKTSADLNELIKMPNSINMKL